MIAALRTLRRRNAAVHVERFNSRSLVAERPFIELGGALIYLDEFS